MSLFSRELDFARLCIQLQKKVFEMSVDITRLEAAAKVAVDALASHVGNSDVAVAAAVEAAKVAHDAADATTQAAVDTVTHELEAAVVPVAPVVVTPVA